MEPLVDWMGFGLEGEGCCIIQASEDVFSLLVLIVIQIHLTFGLTRGAKKTCAHTQMGKQCSSVPGNAPVMFPLCAALGQSGRQGLLQVAAVVLFNGRP